MENNNIFLRIQIFFRNVYFGKQKTNESDVNVSDIEENKHLINYPRQMFISRTNINDGYNDNNDETDYNNNLIRRNSTSIDSVSDIESELSFFTDLEYGISQDDSDLYVNEHEPCKCYYCYIAKKICFIKPIKCINNKSNKKTVKNDSFIYV